MSNDEMLAAAHGSIPPNPARSMDADVLQLEAGEASVTVDIARGGRVRSMVIGGHELLVDPADDDDTLGWGCYPMAPWAGRIRHGRFSYADVAHELPCNLPPHAIHGIGYTSPWTRVDDVTLALEFAAPWPYVGRLGQRFDLTADRLRLELWLEADEAQPAMLGWHPWFRRVPTSVEGARGRSHDDLPQSAVLEVTPRAMYELDDEQIPTGELVEPAPPPWDNCFVGLDQPLTVAWPNLGSVDITSSCDHWVIFTEPEHALCVEPQTEAPDVFNRTPTVVPAGGRLESWMELAWTLET